jgi:hypothetical protein
MRPTTGGKQKVLTACTNRTSVKLHGSPIPVIDKGCPAGTLAFVQFTDALALAVKNREMSEAEATRRFAEYKTQVISGVQRDRAANYKKTLAPQVRFGCGLRP